MKTSEQKIQQRDRMRELRKDPEFKAVEAEKRHEYNRRPEVKAKRAEYRKRPEVRAVEVAHYQRYNVRAEVRERNRKAMEDKRKDQEFVESERVSASLRRAANPEYYRAVERKSSEKRRRFLNLLKMERPCYDCGGVFPPEATDWDHLPGTQKLFTIGAYQKSVSLEQCIDEINKCQLVCACCHRIRTASRKRKSSQVIGQEGVISES